MKTNTWNSEEMEFDKLVVAVGQKTKCSEDVFSEDSGVSS